MEEEEREFLGRVCGIKEAEKRLDLDICRSLRTYTHAGDLLDMT